MSQPDVANAIRVVAKHSHASAEEQWKKAVLRVVKYLKRTSMRGITFQANSDTATSTSILMIPLQLSQMMGVPFQEEQMCIGSPFTTALPLREHLP